MSVDQVLHRISDIQRQFGAVRGATGGFPSLDGDAGTTTSHSATHEHTTVRSGVIVGTMGGEGPTVAGVGTQQQLAVGTGPSISNLASPLQNMVLSSDYGMRLHPVHGDHRMHHGIDLDGEMGDPISTISDGIVTFAGERGGYGNLVIVDHGGGYETRYAHQESVAVSAGDLVRAGDLLGYMGSTGVSTGPHLHFEVRRDGESVDPEPWLHIP